MHRLFLIAAVVLCLAAALTGTAVAQVLESVSFVHPEPNTPNGDPHPGDWVRSGTLTPTPDWLNGLRIADPGAGASLLYVHAAAHAPSAATFRAVVRTPGLPDHSAAWADDVTGFRLVLDDGARRLTLGLGRDPLTRARQLVVLGAPGVAPVPFAWDALHDGHNVFELTRLPNGDFVVTAVSGDAAIAPVEVRIAPASLPASTGSPEFVWGMAPEGGGLSYWAEVHATVYRSLVPFARFAAAAQVASDPETGADRFAVEAIVRRGADSDGIDPLTEDVTLAVGTGRWVIPGGAFRRAGVAAFVFRGVIGPTRLDVVIQPLPAGKFGLAATGAGGQLGASHDPLPITLVIGDDGGETEVTARRVEPDGDD